MKRIWKFTPIVVAALLVTFVWVYGPALLGEAAYAIDAGKARAAREQLAELSQRDHMSVLFRTVSKAVKPAVVVVHVKQKVEYRSMPGGSPFSDEFFRRFFGDEVPEQFRRRAPSPAPKREYFARGLGSGVIVDAKNGYIVTNWHVVRNADKVEVVLSDNRRLEAEWVKTDSLTDLAVIKVKPDRLIDAPLGDSDAMEVGDWVLAIGAPEGLPQTVTAGIISAKGRRTSTGGMSYQDFLQTDAAINHGNSGGPLVNVRGEVVGINTAIVSRTGVNEGIGLSVPSNMVRSIMDQLINKGKVVRGYLGVVMQDVDEGLAKSFKLPNMEGALVTQVMDGSPAARAKIEVGDFLTSINGEKVRNINEVRNAVAELEPGKTYPFEVYRDGKRRTVKVKVDPQPEDMASLLEQPSSPAAGTAKFGFKATTLTDDLRKKYGHDEDVKGVVITEVTAEAAEQGLAEGLVILRVQNRAVTSAEDLGRALGAKDAADGVRLLVADPRGAKRFLFVTPEK